MGDATSLGILLERYRTPLYARALGILSYGPQAEDAVQDAFLVALRKIDHVRDPENVGGWLHAVLRNVCLMRLRASRGEILSEELDQRPERRDYSESSAEESIERLAMREWVWTALSDLPETLRVTAMLRYFGSYSSYEEISAILGVPIGTVRSRLNQVKIKLADALLKTAGLEHSEARRLTESRTRFFREGLERYNRGEVSAEYMEPVAEDVVGIFSDGTSIRGRENFIEDLQRDTEAGMKLHLTNVLASKDITIIEGDFQNPPDNPFRCPPATTQVHFHSGGITHRVHLHFAPRPRREEA
jgi:RNA polymerase sigma factor (sigma-70 family)